MWPVRREREQGAPRRVSRQGATGNGTSTALQIEIEMRDAEASSRASASRWLLWGNHISLTANARAISKKLRVSIHVR
eukprot:scaffold2611_cov114-Isochrysis_galbana.AAC.17